MTARIVDVKHVRTFWIDYLVHAYDEEKGEHVETVEIALANVFEIANNVYKIVFSFEDDFPREREIYVVADNIDEIDRDFIKQLAEEICKEEKDYLSIISVKP